MTDQVTVTGTQARVCAAGYHVAGWRRVVHHRRVGGSVDSPSTVRHDVGCEVAKDCYAFHDRRKGKSKGSRLGRLVGSGTSSIMDVSRR